jgi:hypothetical protein
LPNPGGRWIGASSVPKGGVQGLKSEQSDTAFAVQGTIEIPGIEIPDSLAGGGASQPELTLDLAWAEREISRSLIDIELARCETNPSS